MEAVCFCFRVMFGSLLEHFWGHVGGKLGKTGGKETDSFLEQLVAASWSCLGGLLGCFDALLQGSLAI